MRDLGRIKDFSPHCCQGFPPTTPSRSAPVGTGFVRRDVQCLQGHRGVGQFQDTVQQVPRIPRDDLYVRIVPVITVSVILLDVVRKAPSAGRNEAARRAFRRQVTCATTERIPAPVSLFIVSLLVVVLISRTKNFPIPRSGGVVSWKLLVHPTFIAIRPYVSQR